MKSTKSILQFSIAILTVVALTGCGGPPAKNPLLIDARTQYGLATSNADVMTHAAVPLEEAEEHIIRAEQLWRDGAEPELIDHEAYIGRQKVKIAIETAKLSKAEDEVKRAEVDRQRVQLEARRMEAERAEARAREATNMAQSERQKAMNERQRAEAARAEAMRAQEEAEQARLEAEEALTRAQELAKRVEELEAQQTERGLVLTLGDVLFDVGQANLKAGGIRAVEQLSTFLEEYPERSVLIEGHTDNTGSEALNEKLSLRRADAVRFALIERGIHVNRIRTAGYGESYPVAGNGTSAGRQANRRVEVVISKSDEVIPERQ